MYMLSPYRINPNNTIKRTKKAFYGNFDNNSHHESDVKRPQMTSNDLKRPQSISESHYEVKPVKSKNKLKGGSSNGINEHYLDKIIHNNISQIKLAMQINSNDKTVRNDTIEDLREINSQSLSTQAKKGEQLVSLMPAIKKAFNLLGDDIVELSTENEVLKNKIGFYDEKWLHEPKNNTLKQIDDEKRANLIMSWMKKQMEKH